MVRCTSPRWLRPTWATIRVTQMDMSNFFKPTLFKWMVSGSQKTIPVYFILYWNYRMLWFKKNHLDNEFNTIYSTNIKIWTRPRPHGQQRCTAHCSRGPDQLGSAQRTQQCVLTISTHQVLPWHVGHSVIYLKHLFQVLSKRETSAAGPIYAIFNTGKIHGWDLCDTVVWGCCNHRMIEQNNFSVCEFIHL